MSAVTGSIADEIVGIRERRPLKAVRCARIAR
jgi:hypothetical protein